jgi:integral membrane protein (TIGR01906 family)
VANLAAALFVVLLPLALITTNVRLLFTTPPMYALALDGYDAPVVTGIPRLELARAMDEIHAYFTNDQELLRISVVDDRGQTTPLFTPRKVLHMRDVKDLVRGFFRAQIAALAFVAVYLGVRLAIERQAAWSGLARLTRVSMLGTLAVALGVGGATLVGFDRLFTQFHVLSFSNDLWQLDPARDRLVQLFPFDFWLVATLILTGLTLVEVLALLGLAWWYVRRRTNRAALTADQPGA